MQYPVISLVIPFYNVEKYVAQCLDSVYNQDIPEEQYEVICVNDGSPDNSREIVLEYQKKHPNLILVEHDVNKKLGAARNTGRQIARGKYLWNVDSDDYIKPNSLQQIISICENENLDVLVFNFDKSINNKEVVNLRYPFKENQVLTGIDFINKHCSGHFNEISPVWTQIYRTEFLNEKKIFSPEINMGEDVPYTLKALLLAQRIKAVTNVYYVYRSNENSLGGEMESLPTAIRLYEKCFICSKEVYNLLQYIPQAEAGIMREYLLTTKYIASWFFQYIDKMDKQEKKKLKKLCRKNFFENTHLFSLLGKKNSARYIFKII